MGFFSNWFNFGSKQIEVPQPNYLIDLQGKTNKEPYNPLKWYKENPIVFSAIDERAKAVANAKWRIKTEDGDYIQTALTEFLNKPNNYQTGNEFIYQLVTFMGIWGTAYPYIVRGSRFASLENQYLWNLETECLTFDFKQKYPSIEILSQRELKPIVKYKHNELEKDIDLDRLLPIFDTSVINNPYYAESRLKSLQWEVSNIQRNLEFKNTVLSSPGGVGMLMSDARDASGTITLTQQERERLEKDYAKTYGSGGDKISLRLLSTPMRYESTVPDLKGLKLDDTQTISALNIFGHFEIPKELFTALLNGSTFENQNIAYKRFIQGACTGIANKIARTFHDEYKPAEGVLELSFDHLPIMQENESERQDVVKKKIDNLVSALNNGAITQEEFNDKVQNLIS